VQGRTTKGRSTYLNKTPVYDNIPEEKGDPGYRKQLGKRAMTLVCFAGKIYKNRESGLFRQMKFSFASTMA